MTVESKVARRVDRHLLLAIITGQSPVRTGLTKVAISESLTGIQKEHSTLAEKPKPLGYMTGQFEKNHLDDRDEYLPENQGFDDFLGISTTSMLRKNPRHFTMLRMRDIAGYFPQGASLIPTPMDESKTAGH